MEAKSGNARAQCEDTERDEASAGMASDEMPLMREPYDVMRNGLQGAKSAVTHLGKHPVQLIQDNVRPSPANDRHSPVDLSPRGLFYPKS